MKLNSSINESCSFLAHHKAAGVDSNALSTIVSFIDTDKSIGQLEHVIPETAVGIRQRKHVKLINCLVSKQLGGKETYLMIINCASFVRSLT